MIRTILVDDEELARDRLRLLLKPFEDVQIVSEAENGEEAIQRIIQMAPDLVFLDIQMPGCSGVEVAASLPSPRPRIVFCTAYDQYALDAFELHAVDYLLKPVNRVRLTATLERVRQDLSRAETALDIVLQQHSKCRFLARRGDKFTVVARADVLYFSSEGGLTRLHTRDQYFWMAPSLADLEDRLQREGFFRISRQVLVNLNAIKEIIPMVGGTAQVKLSNGSLLEVSRRKTKALITGLQNQSEQGRRR